MSSPSDVMPQNEKSGMALSVHRLGKRFGDRVAFEDVSFEIAYGEVFGFLGPNGAGKTTTVRTLGTLIAPTSGSATVAGVPLAADNGVEIRRRVSISRASGNCTATTPVLLQMMPQRPMAVSNIV